MNNSLRPQPDDPVVGFVDARVTQLAGRQPSPRFIEALVRVAECGVEVIVTPIGTRGDAS